MVCDPLFWRWCFLVAVAAAGGWLKESAMIQAFLVFNTSGKPRLSKFFTHFSVPKQQQIVKDVYGMVSKRSEQDSNFVDGSHIFDSDVKIIYRHYATLYFAVCCDASESELGILDMIQVFVEVLDRCFEEVCELDLIFHAIKVHHILNEMILGGMVMEINHDAIVRAVQMQDQVERAEKSSFVTQATKNKITELKHSIRDRVRN